MVSYIFLSGFNVFSVQNHTNVWKKSMTTCWDASHGSKWKKFYFVILKFYKKMFKRFKFLYFFYVYSIVIHLKLQINKSALYII